MDKQHLILLHCIEQFLIGDDSILMEPIALDQKQIV
jgi:hypothetical protein